VYHFFEESRKTVKCIGKVGMIYIDIPVCFRNGKFPRSCGSILKQITYLLVSGVCSLKPDFVKAQRMMFRQYSGRMLQRVEKLQETLSISRNLYRERSRGLSVRCNVRHAVQNTAQDSL